MGNSDKSLVPSVRVETDGLWSFYMSKEELCNITENLRNSTLIFKAYKWMSGSENIEHFGTNSRLSHRFNSWF